MNKKKFLVGMGMGLAAGAATIIALRPRHHKAKSVMSKTLKTLGDVAESISDTMGW